MADPRFFAKLDVGYFDNPKVGDFLEERPRVPILHLRAVLYCRQHLTDGVFPVRQVARLACATYCGSQCEGQCDVCAAVDAGLFTNLDGKRAEVHDYLDHQDSAERVKARRSAARDAAARRWDANGNADGNADSKAGRNAKPNAEERRGEERRSSSESDFATFYDLYPKKVAKGQAAKAHKAALKKADASTILAGLKAHLPIWEKTERQFIPNPATWLNGERWADEIDKGDGHAPNAHIPSVDQLIAERGF